VDNALHRGLLAMKNRAVVLRQIAVARGALAWPPGAATGMAGGPQVVQPPPTARVIIGGGTKMPRGVHRPGAAVRGGQGLGRHQRRGGGMHGLSLTQSTGRPVREAPQTVWARWSVCAWAELIWVGRVGLAWTP
jgi:hypothetical protein